MFGQSFCGFGAPTTPAKPAFIPHSSFNDFVQSQHKNVNVSNKISGKYNSTLFTPSTESRDYFHGILSVCKYDYSMVIETDKNIITSHLDVDTRKMMCSLSNLRIIRVTNIPENSVSSPFSFGTPVCYSDVDVYLVCSKSSGFLPQFPNDSVQFSTYDMKYQAYTQLNLVKKSELEKNNYSLDFTDYYMERVVAKPTEIKSTQPKPVEIKRQSEGVTKSTNRSNKTKNIPTEKIFAFSTKFY